MKLALEQPHEATTAALRNGLHEFNMAAMPGSSWNEIVVTLREDNGALRGGVIARVTGESCYIDTVWIDDAARGNGLGTKMVRMAEEEIRRAGARGAWLYTLSVQAKPFYEKLGYAEFAELKWPGSVVLRHFMRKDL
ncbi:MAG: GNAT family N-acetyltransferase [Proteobacteria bacterium]|nr:GNAT family N-acetyltransferase [Pseudomonadota bacterium]